MLSAAEELRQIRTDTSSLASMADRHLERSDDLLDQLEDFSNRITLAQYRTSSLTTDNIDNLNYELRALRNVYIARMSERAKAINNLSQSITNHGVLSFIGNIYGGIFLVLGAAILGKAIENAAEALAAAQTNNDVHPAKLQARANATKSGTAEPLWDDPTG